jgi:hypothetical protein
LQTLRFRPRVEEPIFLLTRVTRIFQKNVFTEATPSRPGGMPRRAFCCAEVSRGCAATSEVSCVKNATNLRLQKTAAGQVFLFPACYLQGAAQL